MLSLDFMALPLLAASALVFIAVLTGIFSARVGFPFLLVFLIAGGLAGEAGAGIRFNNFNLSFWVGNIALAVILADGGLRTDYSTFRTGLKPSLLLATVGVIVSTVLTAAAAVWLLDLSWPMALLLGAIVGSTDAAAVFSLLKSSGVRLNERVAATLEIESGMNDPMAVYLTLTLIGLIQATAGLQADTTWLETALSFISQFSLGAIFGITAGFTISWMMNGLRGVLDSGAEQPSAQRARDRCRRKATLRPCAQRSRSGAAAHAERFRAARHLRQLLLPGAARGGGEGQHLRMEQRRLRGDEDCRA